MHDGRFKNLTEVLKHYATLHGSKDVLLSSALKKIPLLTEHDQTDLIAFLLTLSDREFVFDPAYSFPREFFFSETKDDRKP
jgi:cytochrome c peroxidase